MQNLKIRRFRAFMRRFFAQMAEWVSLKGLGLKGAGFSVCVRTPCCGRESCVSGPRLKPSALLIRLLSGLKAAAPSEGARKASSHADTLASTLRFD
jgi:hypothetical protein